MRAALTASRVGRTAWNPANLCCTKLLSCAQKPAPGELILSLSDDNQHLGCQPWGNHGIAAVPLRGGSPWASTGPCSTGGFCGAARAGLDVVFASERHKLSP